jgi:superfamily II DNA or RNA helicase
MQNSPPVNLTSQDPRETGSGVHAPSGSDAQSVKAGDLVLVRRQRWRVIDIHRHDSCLLVSVAGAAASNRNLKRRFLLPFDRHQALTLPTSLRRVRRQLWRRACRSLVSDQASADELRTACRARIDLLPHQLEPALAVVRGSGCRVLLADDVGLGKTIQAGLIVTELVARGIAARVLVLTPAGLREQWAAELQSRFDIAAAVVDFRDVRQRVARFPIGLNPWTTVPVAVASIDYVKGPEVLRLVAACRWDVLVVDEAHGAASDNERRAAVVALAERSVFVLLLTATPHSGERRDYQALCRIGRHADPLLIFRRTRAEVNLGTCRRVHRLLVRPSAAEARMHSLLREFTRAVRAEHSSDAAWLAISVLHKRALSSAQSLAQSVERRLATLHVFEDSDGLQQMHLPLADPEGESDAADEAPVWAPSLALEDQAREIAMLRTLTEAAKIAALHETKFSAVGRLLDRIAEPAIVFTEYRDTLCHLRTTLRQPVSMLHGGLSRAQRADALRAFVHGNCRLLLATDAAGEGLNLHQRCRVVINLELPWNPIRLEQRIGRVDRIGQTRCVHVFHLIARESGEMQILDRLQARIDRARYDITPPNPIADERAAATLVVGAPSDRQMQAQVHDEGTAPDGSEDLRFTRMRAEAASEVARLSLARRLLHEGDEVVRSRLETAGAWVTKARHRQTRLSLGRQAIALLRVDYEDADGRVSNVVLVPVAFEFSGHPPLDLRKVQAVLRAASAVLCAHAEAAARPRHDEAERFMNAFRSVRLARERSIAQSISNTPRIAWQVGLFDRRADHEHQLERRLFEEASQEALARMDASSRSGVVVMRPARLLLVLAP